MYRILGAYKSQLGAYEVNLDGQTIRMPGFQAGTEEQYQYPLFMANNLSDGVHDIKVTNSEGSLFELDSVGIV